MRSLVRSVSLRCVPSLVLVLAAGCAAAESGRATVSPRQINALACPTSTRCLAVDNGGDAVQTQDARTLQPPWRTTSVEPRHRLVALSCPTINLCVTVDARGAVLVSRDPFAGRPRWHKAALPAVAQGVSCPSVTMCVLADYYGSVTTTLDPRARRPTWETHRVAPGSRAHQRGCVSPSTSKATSSAASIPSDKTPTGRWYATRDCA